MTAKQLTDSILQMAIQGKLVPQDPKDEPASVLLDRIRDEKKRLVKEGKLKKKALEETPISEDEKLFEIPESWEWCKLGWIGNWGAGATPAKGIPEFYMNGTIPWLRTGELNNGIVYDSEIKVTPYALQKCSLRECQVGDVLIAMYGATIGKVAIAGIELTTNQACCACTPYQVYNKFLLYYLMASKQRFIDLGEGGAQPNISREKLIAFPFPLPPLAEQHRIVERIEEYLPVIKEYGEAYDEASKMDAELPDKLKKSILQEAIMGKLGTQDPSDAPASCLLNDIRAEKQKLVEEGVLKKKDLVETPVEDDEVPFNIPDTWEWGRLGDFFTIGSGLSYKKEDLQITSDNKVRVLRGGNISFGDWCQKPDDIFISKKFVADELLLKEWTFITPAVSSLEHMGKTALIRESYDNIVVGGFILMLFPVYKSRPFLEYLNFLFQSYYYRQLCQSLTNKSGQAFYNLSRTKLLNAVIPIPPVDEQIRIVKKVEELFGEIDNMTVENNININEIEVTDNE